MVKTESSYKHVSKFTKSINNNESKWQLMKSQKTYYMLLIPGAIALLIFSYLPMIGLIMSFQDYQVQNGFFGSEFVGLKHFKVFLQDPDFYNALKNTLGISTLTIFFGFPAPIILALLLDNIKNVKLKKVTQTISYLPHFVSWVIVASLTYRMLDREGGIINLLLKALGQDAIGFMHKQEYFWFILIFVAIWKEIGWDSIIYLASMSSIDPQLYDAAMVDGAGKFKQVVHITLPSIFPTISLMLILKIGTLLTVNFDAVFNLMNPLVLPAAEVIDTYVYRTGIQLGKYSYATAIGFAQSTISIILVFIALKAAKKVNGYSII